MNVAEFLVKFRNHKYASMVDGNEQVKSAIIDNIWNGLLDIHSNLFLKQDQAVILVPEERRIFKLDYTDSNVIMETMNKFANDSLYGNNENARKMIEELGLNKPEIFVRDVPNAMGKSGAVTEPNEEEEESLVPQFTNKKLGILKVLDIYDSRGRVYAINSYGAFMPDKITLYLPYVEKDDIVYVTYKPMPMPIVNEQSPIDLTDDLIDLLFFYCFKEQVKNYDLNVPAQVIQYYNNQYEERVYKRRLSGNGQIPMKLNAERLVSRKGFI